MSDNEFFEKPVDKEKLLDRIKELLAEGLVRKGKAVRILDKIYIKKWAGYNDFNWDRKYFLSTILMF